MTRTIESPASTTDSSAMSTIETTPVDSVGQLMHAEDAMAQTCLAFAGLESALTDRGLEPEAITAIRLRSSAASITGDLVDAVREHLLERLGERAWSVPIAVESVARFADPEMLVSLQADVVTPVLKSPTEPTTSAPQSNQQRNLMSALLTPTWTDPQSSRPLTDRDLASLRGVGSVLFPGDLGYEAACTPWNVAIRLRPVAVAMPSTVDEVVEVVSACTAIGLRIAPQSTGHLASRLADQGEKFLLLRMSRLTGVHVDPGARTVRVLGATLWRDVIAATTPYGLTALHGSAGDVAVAGYVLGGGVSFYGRKHGLASNSVRAFEVITAAGELVRATATEHPELFWALRGGGGNFGVLVAVELDLLPIADVYAGMLLWDLGRAPEVLRAWAAWTAAVPESVTTSLRFMRFPPLPELPPFLSGRSLVVVDGAILADDRVAAELLAPLRALAPELDMFGRIPAAGLLEVHMDPPVPSPGVSDHLMLDELSDDAIDALLAAAGPGVPTPLTIAELRHLGGAFDRAGDGAMPRLFGQYALFTLCAAPTPELLALGDQVTAEVAAAMRPWSNGRAYLNFAERDVDLTALYDGDVRSRLARVRDSYDPQRLWIAAHPV